MISIPITRMDVSTNQRNDADIANNWFQIPVTWSLWNSSLGRLVLLHRLVHLTSFLLFFSSFFTFVTVISGGGPVALWKPLGLEDLSGPSLTLSENGGWRRDHLKIRIESWHDSYWMALNGLAHADELSRSLPCPCPSRGDKQCWSTILEHLDYGWRIE